ncbi:hypothetical protein [Streptomyces sp. NWU339]|uniref:hypothetical protein n=1 Tax=Streptomyces sp. NWU339 TaxID=2185284 RepID=UPI0011B7FF14|nr:hypothetical protein [Streptomyces sp. NWU339]
MTGRGRRNNAIRHFLWQASLTFLYGARAAKRLGDAHEWGEECPRRGRCDTRTDQFNSRQARAFASSSWNRREMTRFHGRGQLLGHLYNVGDWLYRRGYLE